MPVALAALFGAVFGSFFNVVAYRLPRSESLVTPGSHCPKCGTAIKPYDNIPVIGWLLLRGRCRSCHEQISARYPMVEAITAVLAVITGTLVGALVMARLGVKVGRKTAVPFGPFLALGGVVALFAGPTIVHWYLHTVV